jgi:hypothetical protein
MLLEGVPRGAVRVVRSAGYWVGSVVGGGGGRFVGTWAITRRLLASFFWRLEFSSVGRFFLSSFVHSLKILSRWARWLLCCGPRGVVATRGRGRAQKHHRACYINLLSYPFAWWVAAHQLNFAAAGHELNINPTRLTASLRWERLKRPGGYKQL